MRSKPKSKVEEITGLLAGKLAERLELCCELLLLLRRSQQKVSDSRAQMTGVHARVIRVSREPCVTGMTLFYSMDGCRAVAYQVDVR